MDVVIWAVVIGYLFGTVNGAITRDGFVGFTLGSLLLLASMAFSVLILVN